MTPLLGGLVVLLVTFALTVSWLQAGELEEKRTRSLAAAGDLMETHLDRDSNMMHALLHVMKGEAALRAAMEAEDREELMALTEERFGALRETSGLTHLYFIRPDRTTLLRVHRPDLRDDLIDRRTMLEAEESGRPVSGLEVGRYRGQLTMRVVHPWHDGDRLLGYLEIGKEVGHVLEDMASTLALNLLVILDKRTVERRYWEDGMRALGREADWDMLGTGLVVHQTLGEVPPEVIGHWEGTHGELRKVVVEGRYLHGGSLPVEDVRGDELGRLIVLRDATALVARAQVSLATVCGIAVLLGLGLLLALVPFLGKLQGQTRLDFGQLQDTQRQLKTARDEALAASESKSEFLASMSHEIRTPMNGVVGMTELLLASDLDDEQIGFATTIRSSAAALLTVINEILDFSKIEAGRVEIKSEELDPTLLLQEVRSLLVHSAEEKGLRLELRVERPPTHLVYGDAGRIRQILINLIGNAIKFTDAGAVTVSLDAKATGEDRVDIVLAVSDTGIGIPAERLESVFQRFTQVDGSWTRRHGGTGLGLAISKQLVELMGGTLDVSSEIDRGSTFTLRLALPRGAALSAPTEEAPATARAADALSPLPFTARVLLVEDNRVNQRVAQRMLEAMGCETTLAADGREGVDAVRSQRFDIVFMDCQMPVLDGFDAAREIRALDGDRSSVPILALSANAMLADQERALASGMDGYLLKPVAAADLRAAIVQWAGAEGPKTSAA